MLKYLSLVLLLLTHLSVYANLAVIVHPSQSLELGQDEVSRLFMGRAGEIAGVPLVPLNLTDAHPLKGQFDEVVLGRSSSQIKAYWSRLVFTGKGTPPKEVSSESEVMALVANNPNIIGYVALDKVDDSVRVAATF
ncbi:phosphate ABC transporter substrate-binding protein [Alkalimonas delamerensis]|uniref:Phosphate ABC transporter substrate-binding protein n=1 Tax=Alkalimonas delamerensis TaxID=265981 RepID=A0ABT9GL48_9GAMM|nr:phosphate ABC transporter substrate-binding protein [Alkalimonas delamerensis]MDP4527693.1 phosphate ABC transporter substrate-binding protein [Alkalimonas delamerensis]